MHILEFIALFVGGLFAGFVNTLAGGGSMVSLSLLMLFGLDANVANGTNRVAIIFQSLTSSETFRSKSMLDLRRGRFPVILATLGSLGGAWVATDLNKNLLEKIIAVVMLLMLFFVFYKPSIWLKGSEAKQGQRLTIVHAIVFLMIGFYGGFVQVGIGYLLLAGLVLQMGYDLVKANALKVFITFVYSPFAFLIFLWHGQVDWLYAIPLAIGAIGGAYGASHLAIRKGSDFIRWILATMIIITVLQAFGVINFTDLLSRLKNCI